MKLPHAFLPAFKLDKPTKIVILLNAIFVLAQIAYLITKIKAFPPLVPLWYTRAWGENQLAKPGWLLILPALTLLILATSIVTGHFFEKKNLPEIARFSKILATTFNAILTYSCFRIINISSLPTPSFLQSNLGTIALPLILSALITYFAAPSVIKFTHRFGIIDDPATHKHPAILHNVPVPRAGALAFFVGFIATALIFTHQAQYLTEHYLVGLFFGVALAIVIGIIDDKLDLNPYLRLGLLAIAASIIILSGVRALYIDNPINGLFRLDQLKIQFKLFGPREIVLLADVFSLLWLLWVANMLSWSNGVDGQFSGVVAIGSLVIAILSLRPGAGGTQGTIATLAAAAAGGAVGLLPFTWHPAKIFWGFGATAVGLIIATLAIFSGTKIATASLILMVPLLDALYAVIRRLRAKKSPFFGDRAHLHHKLLDRGWTHQKIALFYWLATAVLGGIALISSGKTKLLAIITAAGLVGFVIAIVSLKGEGGRVRLKSLAAKVRSGMARAGERRAENGK